MRKYHLFFITTLFYLATAQAQDKTEQVYWKSVVCKERLEVLAYLEVYPRGAFIDAAQDCLDEISLKEQREAQVIEEKRQAQKAEKKRKAQAAEEKRQAQAAEKKRKAQAEEKRKAPALELQLAQCKAHFAANRLLTGQGGNALDCYKGVLQIAPGNAQALAGIAAIEEKYIAWAADEKKREALALEPQLAQCKAHFAANRLLTGQGGNALDCYKGVLQIAPGNAQALAGMTAIEEKYIAWARRELQRHDVARAQTYLQRLKTLNPEREEVAELERRIKEQKREAQRLGAMVAIPSGSFRMGDLSGHGYDDELPVHRVNISPFFMGAYEVTVGQFGAFVEDSGYVTDAEANRHGEQGCEIYEAGQWKYRAGRSWRSVGFSQGEAHPVVCLSHNDAQAFIRWLNKKTGQHYRLPTEAEWEYAARAGSTTQYHLGEKDLCTYANGRDASSGHPDAYACSDGYQYTAPVGSFKPNQFGLYDMHGNAGEWVGDWYADDYYSNSPLNDPQGSSSGEKRVHRGNDWQSGVSVLRSAYRGGWMPDNRGAWLGFRLARQP